MDIDLRTKRILVTGGAGFLGAHLIKKLHARGAPRENIFAPRSHELDFRILENCETAVAGRDLVIHLAGITGGIAFHRENPARIFYDNCMIGVELMEAARRAGVAKFVTIGSATEYPEGAPLPFRESDLWRGYPEPMHAPYTIAKKMLSVQAAAYRAQYGFNAVHLLLTNMYGPGLKRESDFVIPSLIKRIWKARALALPVVEVWGTGRPTRDFLYVEDAAEGIALAAERYDKADPVNIASGWEIAIRELAALVGELMGFKGEITFDATKPDGQMRRVLDTSRAEREFGFRAVTDFKTGLRETVRWYEKLLADVRPEEL